MTRWVLNQKPCGECLRFRRDLGANIIGICTKKLMTVLANEPVQSPAGDSCFTDFASEAYELHGKLSRAYYEEDAKRDRYFNPAADKIRLARLEYLKCKAADRWRRRNGVAPIYTDLRRPSGGRLIQNAA